MRQVRLSALALLLVTLAIVACLAAASASSASESIEPPTEQEEAATPDDENAPPPEDIGDEHDGPLDPTDPRHFARNRDAWTGLCARLRDGIVPAMERSDEAEEEKAIIDAAINVRHDVARLGREWGHHDETPTASSSGGTRNAAGTAPTPYFGDWDCAKAHALLNGSPAQTLQSLMDSWAASGTPEKAAALVDEFRGLLVSMRLVHESREADTLAAMDDVTSDVRKLLAWRKQLDTVRGTVLTAAADEEAACGHHMQAYYDVIDAMTAGHNEEEAEQHRHSGALGEGEHLALEQNPEWGVVMHGARDTLRMCDEHFANAAGAEQQ